MTLLEIVSAVLLILGAVFFLAGTLGVLRFRDVHSRLHALTKADNLGLGFISVSLMIRAESVSTAVKIFLVWILALIASSLTCYAIAEWEMNHGRKDRGL